MGTEAPTPFFWKMIRQRAEKVLQTHGLNSLPIDPFRLAEISGIVVQPKPDTEEGVSGMLLSNGSNFGIMYATHLHNEGFERFSVAHELGHFFLDGHPAKLFAKLPIHVSKAGYFSDDQLEREADTFAASLLMPEDLFCEAMEECETGLSAVETLAQACLTSLTATAIRYAELSTKPAAVIVSTDGVIDFTCFSKAFFKIYDERPPRRGSNVPQQSPTGVLAKDPSLVEAGGKRSKVVTLSEWSDSADVEVFEEALGLGRYGKVLTVLSLASDEANDDY